jgi:hypothetical protein
VLANNLPHVSKGGLELFGDSLHVRSAARVPTTPTQTRSHRKDRPERVKWPHRIGVRSRFRQKACPAVDYDSLIDTGACLALHREGLFANFASNRCTQPRTLRDCQGNPVRGGDTQIQADCTVPVLGPDGIFKLICLKGVSMVSASIDNDIILGYPTLWAYGLAQVPELECLIRISDYPVLAGMKRRSNAFQRAVIGHHQAPTLPDPLPSQGEPRQATVEYESSVLALPPGIKHEGMPQNEDCLNKKIEMNEYFKKITSEYHQRLRLIFESENSTIPPISSFARTPAGEVNTQPPGNLVSDGPTPVSALGSNLLSPAWNVAVPNPHAGPHIGDNIGQDALVAAIGSPSQSSPSRPNTSGRKDNGPLAPVTVPNVLRALPIGQFCTNHMRTNHMCTCTNHMCTSHNVDVSSLKDRLQEEYENILYLEEVEIRALRVHAYVSAKHHGIENSKKMPQALFFKPVPRKVCTCSDDVSEDYCNCSRVVSPPLRRKSPGRRGFKRKNLNPLESLSYDEGGEDDLPESHWKELRREQAKFQALAEKKEK